MSLISQVVDQLMIYLLMFYLMRVSMLLWKAGLPLLAAAQVFQEHTKNLECFQSKSKTVARQL